MTFNTAALRTAKPQNSTEFCHSQCNRVKSLQFIPSFKKSKGNSISKGAGGGGGVVDLNLKVTPSARERGGGGGGGGGGG